MQQQKSSNVYAIVIIGVLFFVFGFVTWLNGTLIPFLKLVCELETDIQAFFVTFAFYMAYFFLALPSSYIIGKTGFKKGMAIGLVVMALGSLVFIPAANARSYPMFLTGLFIQGAGLSLLQTASNPYVAIIGPIQSAARRLSIMGICNKVAGILSPIILGVLVLKNTNVLEEKLAQAGGNLAVRNELLTELSQRVIPPYIVMAVVLILLGIMILKSSLPEIDMEKEEEYDVAGHRKTSINEFPYMLLGVVCLFLYVGVEVMAGDAIGAYGREMGMSLNETKYFTSYTIFGMLIGYVVGIITIPKYLSQQAALAISAFLGIIFSIGAYFTTGYPSIYFVAALGIANALMWPAIFSLSIDGLGKFTKTASALLIMGIAGGALVPLLYTYLKDHEIMSNHSAFLVCMLPSYIYILYYALHGFKVGNVRYTVRAKA